MKKFTLFISAVMLLCMTTSCRAMKTVTPVGEYQVTQGTSHSYAKGKQLYIFWGLVRLGHTTVATPPDGNCSVQTYHTFWDGVLTCLTGGIVSAQTIEVRTKRVQFSSSEQRDDKNVSGGDGGV